MRFKLPNVMYKVLNYIKYVTNIIVKLINEFRDNWRIKQQGIWKVCRVGRVDIK